MTEMTRPNATTLQQEELELEELMWHTQAPKDCLYEHLDDTPADRKPAEDQRRVA